MSPIFIIAQLTIREAQRRRILWVALLMAIAFLVLFGTGMHYIIRDMEQYGFDLDNEFDLIPISAMSMAGLYVTNFLVVIMSVLISVASISSEIESRLIDTLITKPIHRRDIVLGKWAGFAIMSVLYNIILAGGVILITYLRTGYLVENVPVGLLIMSFNGLVMMTVTIMGGTRLSTLANGVLAFMLYGLAFVGGWVETIGALVRNESAVNLGIAASLIMPIEALWRKASILFQPLNTSSANFAGPFAVSSEPSDAMLVYAVAYVIVLLLIAVRAFGRRDL